VSLEVVTIAGISILVFLFSAGGSGFGDLLPVLGLFAVAALRVQPAVTRVIANVNSIRFNKPIVDEIYKDLDSRHSVKESFSRDIQFDKEIELREVSFNYGLSEQKVLQGLNLKIQPGEVIGVSGSSGAGKTTLIDILLGVLQPTSGTVCVDGIDISQDLRGWQNQVGFVPQSVYLIDDSIEANIALGIPKSAIDHDRVRAVLRDVDLLKFVENLPDGVQTKVGERGTRLSGGQLQRIGIARALYRRPKILFLDESTSSLDSETEESVMASIRLLVGKITLVIIAHRESTLQNCSRRIIIDSGRLVGDYHSEGVNHSL
jgi:ABC-type multidrug transport system fused ATPase/permease subunit